LATTRTSHALDAGEALMTPQEHRPPESRADAETEWELRDEELDRSDGARWSFPPTCGGFSCSGRPCDGGGRCF